MKYLTLFVAIMTFCILGSVVNRTLMRRISRRISKSHALVEPVAAAVLADPEKFGNAAESFAKALGLAVDVLPRAIEALKSARSLISSTTTEKAIITNSTLRDP
jgi:pantoate kinase